MEDAPMMQYPAPVPTDSPAYVPGPVESFVGLFIGLLLFLSIIALLLPRPWFQALFRIALPFMPEKMERQDD